MHLSLRHYRYATPYEGHQPVRAGQAGDYHVFPRVTPSLNGGSADNVAAIMGHLYRHAITMVECIVHHTPN